MSINKMQTPTYQDILTANEFIKPILSSTPLYEYPGLNQLANSQVFIKHENHQPVGAFKVRGGVYLIGTLSDQEKSDGVIGCSTGNHGQSLAYASRHFGVNCKIIVPKNNNPDKNRAIQLLGAELIERGNNFNEAKLWLESELKSLGGRYIHSANEPKLIAGVGTQGIEIFEKVPRPDAIVVPVGMGSGICGIGIVAKHLYPDTKIIGVQAENAPAIYQSWKSGKMESTDSALTWAEGVATCSGAELTLEIMKSVVDDFILVSEDEMREAAYLIMKNTHNLAEGAGAATLAAILKNKERFKNQKVVAILSGGNIDLKELPKILQLH